MSSALVRQALEFVDQEEKTSVKRKTARSRGVSGQGRHCDNRTVYKRKNKKQKTLPLHQEDREERTLHNIEKLLTLSTINTDTNITEKIVERAIKGKPLLEKIPIKTEEEKSILFSEEESFGKFEKEYFCS